MERCEGCKESRCWVEIIGWMEEEEAARRENENRQGAE